MSCIFLCKCKCRRENPQSTRKIAEFDLSLKMIMNVLVSSCHVLNFLLSQFWVFSSQGEKTHWHSVLVWRLTCLKLFCCWNRMIFRIQSCAIVPDQNGALGLALYGMTLWNSLSKLWFNIIWFLVKNISNQFDLYFQVSLQKGHKTRQKEAFEKLETKQINWTTTAITQQY